MSWTSRVTELRLRWVWHRRIAPAARKMRSRDADFLGTSGGSADDSWYVEIDPETPQFTEVESDGLAAALDDMWSGEGLDELAEISGSIAGLAAAIGTEDASSSDVSSDAYAMY